MHPFTSTIPVPTLYMPYPGKDDEDDVVIMHSFTSTVPPALYMPYTE